MSVFDQGVQISQPEGGANRAGMDMVHAINLIKGAMAFEPQSKPVGVHMASTNFPQKLPPNADWYGMEFPWGPDEAEKHSIDEGLQEAKRVIDLSPVPVFCVTLYFI